MNAGTQAAGRVAFVAAAAALCATLFVSAPASASPTAPGSMAAAVGGACGSLNVGATSSGDVMAAENCFSHAYASCDSAMLSVTYSGAADGVARTFQTMRSANDDSCQVAEVVDHFRGGALAQSDTFLCAGVKQATDGITFVQCGKDGDVLIPADLTSASAKRLMTAALAFNTKA
jgi:hypothetical protein